MTTMMKKNQSPSNNQTNHSSKPGYKLTKLGWIPDEWEVKKLGDLADVTSGGTPDRKNDAYWNGDIPWITTSLIDFKDIEQAEEFITEEGLMNSAAKMFEPGTILLALYGQGKTRGKVGLLRIKAATNQACAAITVENGKLQNSFLFHHLVGKYDSIRALSNTGSQDNLSGALIKSIPVPVPSLPEQRAIANLLSTWDRTIQLTTKLIVQKELRKTWLMQVLLSGMKRLPGFEGKWKEVRLGEVFENLRTASFTRDQLGSRGTIACIHYGDIHTKLKGEMVDLNASSLPFLLGIEFGEFDFLNDGDVVMADASEDLEGVGECVEMVNVGDRKVVAGLHTIALRDNKNLTSARYRTYALLSSTVRNQMRKLSTGASVLGLSKSNLGKVLVSLPSLQEQTAIASALQTADKEIQLLSTKLEKQKEQKKGLMQVLLTGKKRLEL